MTDRNPRGIVLDEAKVLFPGLDVEACGRVCFNTIVKTLLGYSVDFISSGKKRSHSLTLEFESENYARCIAWMLPRIWEEVELDRLSEEELGVGSKSFRVNLKDLLHGIKYSVGQKDNILYFSMS